MIKIERSQKNGEVIRVIDLRPTKFKDGTICYKSRRVLKEVSHPSKHSFARHCRQKGDPRWNPTHPRNFYDHPPGVRRRLP